MLKIQISGSTRSRALIMNLVNIYFLLCPVPVVPPVNHYIHNVLLSLVLCPWLNLSLWPQFSTTSQSSLGTVLYNQPIPLFSEAPLKFSSLFLHTKALGFPENTKSLQSSDKVVLFSSSISQDSEMVLGAVLLGPHCCFHVTGPLLPSSLSSDFHTLICLKFGS